MTCIAAAEVGGRVIMGADSCISVGNETGVNHIAKVFRRGRMVVGAAGCVRQYQRILTSWRPPERSECSTDTYVPGVLVKSIRAHLGVRGSMDLGILVGVGGRLYRIEHDMSVWRAGCGYNAVGSGADVAMGALCVLSRNGPLTARSVRAALHAASRHVSGVKPPFVVMTDIGG